VFLDVAEETMFCVSERISGDYVLSFWTYLRRLCSSENKYNKTCSLYRFTCSRTVVIVFVVSFGREI
jgi:hypothetical protein